MRTAGSLAQTVGDGELQLLQTNYMKFHHNLILKGKKSKIKTAKKLRPHVVLFFKKVKKPKENDILENRKNSTKIIFQYCEVKSSTLSCFLLKKKVRS